MDRSFLSFANVSFRYSSSPVPIFENLHADFPKGWTGIVGANGVGKTTLLLLASGALAPSAGTVRAPGEALYCAQRTDEAPELLAEMLGASDSRAGELCSRLGIQEEWVERWENLSHGERKRAQIAVVLWKDPPVLCVDEPTNHVDSATRRLLLEGLRVFRGIGLLVSHDRELLDELCARCLVIDPPRITMRPGTYSETAALESAEKARAREEYLRLRQTERELRRKLVEKKREAAESRSRLSKRGIDKKDSDAKAKIDLARLTSKDRTPARQVREIDVRLSRAGQAAAAHAVRKEYDLGLWFDSEPARRDVLFDFPAGSLPLGDGRSLQVPDLLMLPRDRVALTGPNGSGKSTLVRWIVAHLPLDPRKVISMPQEIDAAQSARISAELHGMAGAQLGRVLTVVNLLGSDSERILGSASLSPGEARKVLLAIGIARVPHLIVMDEPTNHLDLPSIECLIEALAACRCALLLVSHDELFLSALTSMRWSIKDDKLGVEVGNPAPARP